MDIMNLTRRRVRNKSHQEDDAGAGAGAGAGTGVGNSNTTGRTMTGNKKKTKKRHSENSNSNSHSHNSNPHGWSGRSIRKRISGNSSIVSAPLPPRSSPQARRGLGGRGGGGGSSSSLLHGKRSNTGSSSSSTNIVTARGGRFTSVLTQPFPYWNTLEEMFGDFMAEEWNPAQRSCIIGSLIRFFELKIMLGEYTPDNQLLSPTQLIAHAWHVLLLETQTYKSVLFYIQDFHAVRPHRLLHHALLRRHEFKEYERRLERTQRLFETYYGRNVRMPATLDDIPHQDKQFLEDGVLEKRTQPQGGGGVENVGTGLGGRGATETFWGDISGSTADHTKAGLASAVAAAAAAGGGGGDAGAAGGAQTPPRPTGYFCGNGGYCATVGCGGGVGAGTGTGDEDEDAADAYFTFGGGSKGGMTQVTPPSSAASDDRMDVDNEISNRGQTHSDSKSGNINTMNLFWTAASCLPAFDCFESIRADFWCVRNGPPCFENQEIAVEDENISILTPPDLMLEDVNGIVHK